MAAAGSWCARARSCTPASPSATSRARPCSASTAAVSSSSAWSTPSGPPAAWPTPCAAPPNSAASDDERSPLTSQPEGGAELRGRRGRDLAAVLVTVEAAADGREQARTGERVGAVGEQGGRAGHAEPFGLRLAGNDAPGHLGTAGQQAIQPRGQQVGAGTPWHLQDLQCHGW